VKELSIVISIVSLGHDEFIFNNLLLNNNSIPPNIRIVITDLTLNSNFERALKKLNLPNLLYHTNPSRYGYGKNNNIVFKLFGTGSDIFMVCNPDIEFDFSALNRFITGVEWKNHLITCRTDIPGGIRHNNIRRFFNPIIWIGSFLKTIDFDYWYYGNSINEIVAFDWCSGAFMIFDSVSFDRLGGFDEGYFIYIEDTDICYRCDKLQIQKKYYPTFAVKHFARRKSKNIFSRHFFWMIRSVMRYYMKIYLKRM